MEPLRLYMGDDYPIVPCWIDPHRWVNPATGGIAERLHPPKVALHWVVAVVDCPHCGAEHEHHMAARVGWGHYRAGCSKRDNSLGYYLITE
jgi:hypothetical protein